MYDIVIIIDKSSFQLLSFQELLKLSQYYKHNVTPILVMEIIGDLKKEMGEGKNPSDARVKDFAVKLFPTSTILNGYYEQLVREDLMGNHPNLDGRPHVGVEKTVRSETGMRGFVVEETEQQKAIYKWRDGHFTEADHALSAAWRSSTTEEGVLEKLQSTLKNDYGKIKLSSTEELITLVEKVVSNPDNQDKFLATLIANYGIDEATGMQIFYKWQQAGRPLIHEFAPYACHCLKVDLCFLFGLQSHLIGTRATNRVDMEYLYYIPFCHVFTSNDNFHKHIAPLFLRPDQVFVDGNELKKDLKLIVEHLNAGGQELKVKHVNEPPVIEESLTFQLWKKYFAYPEQSNWNRNLSEKEMEYVKRKMDEFEKAAANGEEITWSGKEGEEPEFILRRSYLSKYDPCYCGSGKRVIDCCLPEEEFNKRAKNFYQGKVKRDVQ